MYNWAMRLGKYPNPRPNHWPNPASCLRFLEGLDPHPGAAQDVTAAQDLRVAVTPQHCTLEVLGRTWTRGFWNKNNDFYGDLTDFDGDLIDFYGELIDVYGNLT